MKDEGQYEALKREVVILFGYLQRIKEEIASVKHPKLKVDRFDTVADQLKAIAKTTEEATETIMDATDSITEAASQTGSEEAITKINDAANAIFEACSFQDITGQRISKIVKTMNQIEGSLNSLVVIVGESGLLALPLSEPEEDPKDPDMHGPQLEGEGVSQKDIDKLFD